MGTHSSYNMDSRLVVTLIEVSEKEDGVVALHQPNGP